MGETRLMSPIEEPINLAADALMAAMKKVKSSVMPLQYNLKRLIGSSLEKTGDWKEGIVEAEIFVSDLLMKRKSVISVRVLIKNGKAEEPFSFSTSTGKVYPWTEAGFRKSLNIPLTPYISKRPGAATLSSRRD
jgi:epoxyqueuosine reductase QueG